MRRVLTFAAFAVLSAGSLGLTSAHTSPAGHRVQAEPICVTAGVSGTLTGTHTVGPKCVGYPFSTVCSNTELGASPQVLVDLTLCVPRD